MAQDATIADLRRRLANNTSEASRNGFYNADLRERIARNASSPAEDALGDLRQRRRGAAADRGRTSRARRDDREAHDDREKLETHEENTGNVQEQVFCVGPTYKNQIRDKQERISAEGELERHRREPRRRGVIPGQA